MNVTTAIPAPEGPARSGRKMAQVIQGARTVFMRDGFEGASVDAIAKEAGVSKATLYSYFSDKKLLFLEVGRLECESQSREAFGEIDLEGPIAEVLGRIGREMAEFMVSPFGQNIFRICVAEAARFPELGRHFYETGPLVVRQKVAAVLRAARDRGELRVEDAALAAEQFFELSKVDIFPRMIFGMTDGITEADIDRTVDAAVEMFMARYGA